MLIDTHCHIDGSEYEDKKSVIVRAKNNGVSIIVNSGSDVKSSIESQVLSKVYDEVYFTAGVHPDGAETFNDGELEKIRVLAKDKKCLAIGEIGLDYHYQPFDKKKQAAAFTSQLVLADKLNLPVVIHSRDAHADTLSLIKELKPKKGTMHCFSGSVELAKEYLDLGFYLSFGGTLTFKNNVKTVEVLKYAPIDRILTETDSPYLSPEPKRGTKNEPANIRYVVEKIADLKNLSFQAVENAVYENALRLFDKLK